MVEIIHLDTVPETTQAAKQHEKDAHKNMEVKLNLIAVGSTREEIGDRFITLNKNVPFISVGRSSKNPTKALEPSRNNAIFDCPIMSRDHARFEIAELSMKIVVKDLGSTHGTFLRKERLQAHKAYTLGSGEDITFGVEVTNGPQVHSAKTFRVFYSMRLNNQLPPTIFSGFRAPEYESASASDDSREASVQILEKPTQQYSLCSSDEESDSDYEFSDSEEERRAFDKTVEQVSAVTTPDSKMPWLEPLQKTVDDVLANLRNGSKPLEKTTDLSPPNDQTKATHGYQPEVHDIASEDEHIDNVSQGEQDAGPVNSTRPSPAVRPQNPLSAILNEKSDGFKENLGPISSTVPEAQPEDNMTEEEVSEYDMDSSESDYGDSEHESEEAPPSPKGKEKEDGPSQRLHQSSKEGQALEKKMDYIRHTSMACDPPSQRLQQDEKRGQAFEIYRPGSPDYPPLYRRSPSPSDAAVPQRNFGPSVKNSTAPTWQTSMPASFYHTPYADFPNAFGSSYSAYPYQYQFQQSILPTNMTSFDPVPPTYSAENVGLEPFDFEELHRPSTFRQILGDKVTSKPDESTAAPKMSSSTASHPEVSRKEGPQTQFHRLDISDLINGSQSVGGTPDRPLKRKAAMITQDPVENEKSSEAVVETAITQQDQVTETLAPESILPEAQDQTMRDDDVDDELSLERTTASPLLNRLEYPKHVTEAQSPPPKRTRTAYFTVGGMAKYVTAAAVGAIGAIAAIVATAPESVKQEAFQEMMM